MVEKQSEALLPDFVVQPGPGTATKNVSIESKESKVPGYFFILCYHAQLETGEE